MTSHHFHPSLSPTNTPTPTGLDLNEIMGFWDGSGISWTICKQSAPRTRQTDTPTPYHSIFTGQMLFWWTTNSVKALNPYWLIIHRGLPFDDVAHISFKCLAVLSRRILVVNWTIRESLLRTNSLGLPFDDVGAQCGEESNHCEAEFVGTAQHQTSHDGNEGHLDVDAVPLAEYQPWDENGEQWTGALYRLRERHSNVLERQ